MSVIVKHASTMYVLVSRSGDLDNYIYTLHECDQQ